MLRFYFSLTFKAPNTTIAEFANTADPDETAHNEPSHLDLQCLPSEICFFNIKQFLLKDFRNFADVILSSAFLTQSFGSKGEPTAFNPSSVNHYKPLDQSKPNSMRSLHGTGEQLFIRNYPGHMTKMTAVPQIC